MQQVIEYIEVLVKKYNYKPLPAAERAVARKHYLDNLPVLNPVKPIYSLAGTLIANCWDRLVIGDYGAYIEFEVAETNKQAMILAPGQEYRAKPEWKDRVKYLWYTTKDDSGCKIYYQRRTVSYADYLVGKCYISPYEVKQ